MVLKHKFWFDEQLAQVLADKITSIYPEFARAQFISDIEQGVDSLELKGRLGFFAERLQHYLIPSDYPRSIQILMSILGEENTSETGMFKDFYWVMPIATYVEHYGQEHFTESISAIAEITKRNTGEFAIRPFLKAAPEKTLTVMEKWSQDDNFHLRRLASEGSRPRLPWAKKLDYVITKPQATQTILENLRDDPVKFVQKSVANHLNDILKDNYEFGMNLVQDWMRQLSPARSWIIKHALRKQAKDGNHQAIVIRQTLSEKSS